MTAWSISRHATPPRVAAALSAAALYALGRGSEPVFDPGSVSLALLAAGLTGWVLGRRRVERALRESEARYRRLSDTAERAERERVEQMKEEFIALVSHEMRTPLTSIHASLALLASGHLHHDAERTGRLVQIAAQNSARLVRLVNDILEMERLRSGRAALEMVAVAAAEVVARAVDDTAAAALERGISVEVSPDPALSCVIRADPRRMVQVLTHLIANGIKFSSPGQSVVLAARLSGREVELSVSDRGRGIPAEQLESVFGRFTRVDASDTRREGGTGLGLALSREIVEHHRGRIWAESTPGEGSTFRFTVPLAA